jgi:carbon storage regulator
MLMMKRRAGESILIGDDIEIHLAHIGRTRVKIGIQAPRHVAVVAKEVKLVRDQNRAAAASPLEGALARLAARVPPKQSSS